MTSDPVMHTYALVMHKKKSSGKINHDEFMEKYGYNNTEFFDHWTSWFFTAETLGYMIKNKIVRAETVYDLGAWSFI